MIRLIRLCFLTFPITALLLSCGEDDGTGPGVGDEGYFTNRENSTWTYEVTDNSGVLSTWNETRTVKGTRDVDGVTCQVIETIYSDDESKIDRTFIKDDEKSRVDIWGMETVVDGTVERSFYFDDGLPLLKYPCTVGDSWDVYAAKGLKPTDIPFTDFEDDDLDDDGVDDTADVAVQADVAAREDVTVRAGAFDGCFKVAYTFDITVYLSSWGEWPVDATSSEWFKPYVGVVKTNTVVDLPAPIPDKVVNEELISYDLPL
jgi:hypothetical protein